jgi:hypothetical protein
MSEPNPSELAAVRAILFERGRLARMADDVASISTLLNLDRCSGRPLR